MVRERIMPHKGAVVATEPVAPIIANATLLGQAAGRFESAGFRIKTKITPANVHLHIFVGADPALRERL